MSSDQTRRDHEMSSLNADNLDAGELDEQALEEVAGGECGTNSCGTYCGTHSSTGKLEDQALQ
jgi:hypothetical protein